MSEGLSLPAVLLGWGGMNPATTASGWLAIAAVYVVFGALIVWLIWWQRSKMPWQCPVCRHREYYGPGFCIRDGSQLVQDASSIKPRCPKCNREHGRRDRYCKECGAKLK